MSHHPVFVALPEDQPVLSPEPNVKSPRFAGSEADFERVTRSVTAAESATYHWNIETDEIVWHGDTSQVFSGVSPENLVDGRAYASLLDPENFTSRFETVMRNNFTDAGKGVPFSIEYSIKPLGRDQERSIRIEDSGRWFADCEGKPNEVFGIVRQIDDRHKQDQHLQFLGNCDPLTGMMNRGRLVEALGETIELARTEIHTSGFLIVAVNNLAIVNDAYGFDVADDVVAKIGRRLRKVVRTGDVIGRFSGSKFGIIMSRTTREELGIATERFLTVARQRVIETESGPVWAMLSIGGIVVPNQGQDALLTMAHAEEALTEAYRMPTDGAVIYQPSAELLSEREFNSRCAVEIVQSLKQNQFTLAYQPVVNAETEEVEFHEALLRMKGKNGVVAAGHLIPIAEKLGLIRLIDQLVVIKVLAALRQFPQAKIAVNISGVTANDPRWFGKLMQVLEENIDVTNRLTVEITETVALKDIDQTVSFIEQLHALGCKVAIDDFGAGFTSFKNLKTLNVDKVKIDGSFCENLSSNQDNQFFVHTLIDLSKKFDLDVVAEWVETREDAQLLTSWGVDFLQGRLFGMPESQSPWGEPINEDEEICVVPSEILLESNEESGDEAATSQNDATNQSEIEEYSTIADPFDAVIPEEEVSLDVLPSRPNLEFAEGQSSDDDPFIPVFEDEIETENSASQIETEASALEQELQKLKDAVRQFSQPAIESHA